MIKHKYYRKCSNETIERMSVSEPKSGEIRYGNKAFASIEELDTYLASSGWVREPANRAPYDTFQRSAR